MPSVILFDIKRSPNFGKFINDIDALLHSKGFNRISTSPFMCYISVNDVLQPQFTGLIKMIKSSPNYKSAVQNIYYDTRLKKA